jgi:hypothetical protein
MQPDVGRIRCSHFFPKENIERTLPFEYEPFFPVASASLAAATIDLKS